MKIIILSFICFTFSLISAPAFPEAQGSGAETRGAYQLYLQTEKDTDLPSVIYVTNLLNSGKGSLRAALEASGPRVILFSVAGIIDLTGKNINVNEPYITIAGQTSPGSGITIKGGTLKFRTHDIIIRYLRFRQGKSSTGGDSFSFSDSMSPSRGVSRAIIDHCSFSWANDENIDIWTRNSPAHNITFSWNIISEGLKHDGKGSYGVLVGSPTNSNDMANIDFHHNIFISNSQRNPRVANKSSRIINNIIYNWEHSATEIAGGISVDIIGNIYKAGPVTKKMEKYKKRLICNYLAKEGKPNFGPDGQLSLYLSGNKAIGLNNGLSDNLNFICFPKDFDKSKNLRKDPLKSPPYSINISNVDDLEDLILNNVGASKRINEQGLWISSRDPIDDRVIEDYRKSTGDNINNESEVGGYPEIQAGKQLKDSDLDGLPDTYEKINKLNPKDKKDSHLIKGFYSHLEVYLNGIPLKKKQ